MLHCGLMLHCSIVTAGGLAIKEMAPPERGHSKETRRLHLGHIGGLLALGAVDDIEFHSLTFCE
jgi:hypothetical protein